MDKPAKEQLIKIITNYLDCTEDLTIEFVDQVLQIIKLFDSKQHDYGSANIAMFAENGVLIRTHDKMARLIQLSKSGKEPKNESIEDSWKDIATYGIIALMCYTGVWPGVDNENN